MSEQITSSEHYMEKEAGTSRLGLGCDCRFRHLSSVSDLTLLGGFVIVVAGDAACGWVPTYRETWHGGRSPMATPI